MFVSRILERKGLQDVLPFLCDVSRKTEQIIGKKTILRIVGDGPYRNALERLVRSLEIEELVIFEGQKDKFELLEYYGNADYFLLPSHWEGMPNVVLEAMAMKLPVIMTKCEGSRELIQNNGYAIDVRDIPDKMVELAIDFLGRKEKGSNSLEIVKNNFSWQQKAEEYLTLIKKIL